MDEKNNENSYIDNQDNNLKGEEEFNNKIDSVKKEQLNHNDINIYLDILDKLKVYFEEKNVTKRKNKEDEENDEYNDFEKSKISEHSILDNKFNNQNQNINVEEKNEFDLLENINDNNNNIENNNNIQSEKDIKEETSLLEKNRNNQEIKVDSGEINEEIDENLNSQKKDIKSSIKEDINSNSDNKAIGSSSTENIERILKS